MTITEITQLFQLSGALGPGAQGDRVLLEDHEGGSGKKVTLQLLAAFLSAIIAPTIDETTGHWLINGEDTGVTADRPAPLMRARNGVIQLSVDEGRQWEDVMDVTSLVSSIAGQLGARVMALETAHLPAVASSGSSIELEPYRLNYASRRATSLHVLRLIPAESPEWMYQEGIIERPEYRLRFTVTPDANLLPDGGFQLTFASGIDVKWQEEPEWEAGYTYEVSIQDGLGVWCGFAPEG